MLNDKTILITGAASGIGKASALACARAGARVAVADLKEADAQSVVDEIEGDGGQALAIGADVSDPEAVTRMVAATVEAFGSLDGACNNAGIGGEAAHTGDYTIEAWDRVIGVNLRGVWLCMREEIARMTEQGGGSIVNMASILGKVGFATAPAYVASKHAVVGLTKTAAIEYAPQGIRVNAVCPGFIHTPMLENAGLMEDQDTLQFITSLHPIGRLGRPEEVAEAVVWLLAEAASFVTGHALLVDGGFTAQ